MYRFFLSYCCFFIDFYVIYLGFVYNLKIMKKLIILLLVLFAYQFAWCQGYSGSKIGISVSTLGNHDIIIPKGVNGSAQYHDKGFLGFGINLQKPISKIVNGELGLEYTNYKYEIAPLNPGATFQKANISLFTLPATIQVAFLKYLFVNGGLLVSLGSNNDYSFKGIGAMGGLGAKFETASGISIFLNPYVKEHALISFTKSDWHYKFYETGFRLGLMYPLN